MQLAGPGDRHDPAFLREQPRQRDPGSSITWPSSGSRHRTTPPRRVRVVLPRRVAGVCPWGARADLRDLQAGAHDRRLFLDRPAIVPEIAEAAAALLVEFGASDDAVLDVLLGAAHAQGRLPFDLPSSMRAVAESRSDVPFDTADPLFRFGDGIVSS
jgi:hypothetical protein